MINKLLEYAEEWDDCARKHEMNGDKNDAIRCRRRADRLRTEHQVLCWTVPFVLACFILFVIALIFGK